MQQTGSGTALTFVLGLAAGLANAQMMGAGDDVTPGERVFGECRQCHSFAPGAGPGKQAPNLWGLWGRTAGTAPGFEYSPELKASGIVWTEANLDKWLRNPGAMVKGAKMDYALTEERDREDVLEYLRDQDVQGYLRAKQMR